MEIIPIEYCDICDDYVHLNQCLSACAFEHQCESGGSECPFKRFFTNRQDGGFRSESKSGKDMPVFYISDL